MRIPFIFRFPNAWSLASCLGMMAVSAPVNVIADDPTTVGEQTAQERRLEQMRERASRATVRLISEDVATPTREQPATVEFEAQPLFRYNDQPRGFRDGTLWMWAAEGRPIALCKIEDWRDPRNGPIWITCFASLSTGLIQSKWDSGPTWVSKKPGLQFRPVEGVEAPDANEAGRLRQFKKLSERFTVSLVRAYDGVDDRQEMRRLPRPLHRYHRAEAGVTDAVLFAWTSNGTNPDAVVVFELRTSNGKNEWLYAFAPVTADKTQLQLDGGVVDSKDYTPYAGGDTVRYFYDKNSSPID